MLMFVKFSTLHKLHVISLYCDCMILYALNHVLLVAIIIASKILVSKFTSYFTMYSRHNTKHYYSNSAANQTEFQ